MDVLERLVEDGIIDEVRGRLMSGKEASVFIVERDGALLAAKVYKEREQRSFKATADYTEGRNQTRSSRDKRAMNKRSRYGKELVEESWREMEYRALNEAFDAGVRVPEPVMLYDNVLLMELLVDEDGHPASRLSEFELTAEVAELLHQEIYGQVRLLLASGKVHGDLSAFNILMTASGPTLIDLPQVVDASGNNKAAEILGRDLRNLTEHLARFNPRLMRFRDCGDVLWRHYQRGTLDRALAPEEGGERAAGKRGRPSRNNRSRPERNESRGASSRHDAPRADARHRDQSRPTQPQQGQGRAPEGQRQDTRGSDTRRPERRPPDNRSSDNRSSDNRQPRDRGPEPRPSEGRGPDRRGPPSPRGPVVERKPQDPRARPAAPQDAPKNARPGDEEANGAPRGRSRRRRRRGGAPKADTKAP